MTTHVMLDLETWGLTPDSVILSIGAAKFDPWGDGIADSIEIHLDPDDCHRRGMTIDARTVLWWMDPDRQAAREALLSHRHLTLDLVTALDVFQTWYGADEQPIWGNGAGFDNVLLRSAYQRANMVTPWQHWSDRCYRTMKNLAPGVEIERTQTHHTAVGDAIDQALHLQAIISHLGLVA